MPEDQQNQPTDVQQQAPKSIDGVRLAPKLSGENQGPHLKESNPVEGNNTQAAAQKPAEKKQAKNISKKSSFPFVAVASAVIIGLALIGLAIFVQIRDS